MKKNIMKRQTRIYKALHRKLNIEQHVPHETAVGWGAPESNRDVTLPHINSFKFYIIGTSFIRFDKLPWQHN